MNLVPKKSYVSCALMKDLTDFFVRYVLILIKAIRGN